MTNIIITDIEEDFDALKAKIEGSTTATVIIQKAEDIGVATWNYIKTNGLTALYSMATALLAGAATGTPFTTLAANLAAQAETAGISIAKGAESIVLAQAQADLVAAGTLVSPSTGTVVGSSTATSAPSLTPAQ
jgi:uncharacterized membrane protein (UPF0136 family)